MKKKNQHYDTNGTKSDSTCITWTGPEIACLDICPGDLLDDVINLIAEKVCEVTGGDDLSTLSLQCLVDKLAATIPTEKNILNILQLVVDNECKLKDLIDIVDAKIINPNAELNLNLKCLGDTDIYGNVLQITQLELDQRLIDEVCSLKTRVLTLEGKVVDLQNQIDEIDTTPYEEPTITTCVATGKTTVVVEAIAEDYCDYKEVIGSEGQIATVIAQQCEGLSAEYAAAPNWIASPSNLAQSLTNLWIAFCDIRNRLTVIENTCCAPTCDKIKVRATAEFNDNDTVTLTFGSGAGTVIPTGFVDCGTTLVITDKNDVSTPTINLDEITIGGDSQEIDISMLAQGELTFDYKTKFCLMDGETVILTCQDCQSQKITNTSGCCTIDASGGDVILLYKICTNTEI